MKGPKRESTPLGAPRSKGSAAGSPPRKAFSPRSSIASSSNTVNVQQRRATPPKKILSLQISTLMGRSIPIKICSSSTIQALKDRIYELEGFLPESQALVYCDKELSGSDVLGRVGIETGSTIKLVVQMNGGPGVSIKGGRSRAPVRSPPRHNRTDKNKKDSSVLLVLCRQNEQLFMLEVHMKTDGTEGDRTETRNELLRLAQSSGLKSQLVLPNGTIEGVKGDEPTQILGLTSRSEESLFQELISEEIIHDERGGPSKRRAFSQKDREEEDESSDNSIIEEDEYLLDSSSVLDYEEEEALSFFYSTNSSRPLSVVSSSSTFLTSLSSSSADRGMTPNSRSGSSSMRHAVVVKKTKKKGSSSSARSNRPATAISIMRIPSGGPIQSLLFSPKSRPSTAALHPGSSMTTLDPPGSEEDEEPQPVSPPRKFTSATRRPKAVRFQDPPIPSLPKSEEIPEQIVEQKEPKTVRLSCPICRKRLPLCSQFRCKCGSTFCSVHRYSDRHDCVYDYKAAGASRLTRENPAVSGDKGIVRI